MKDALYLDLFAYQATFEYNGGKGYKTRIGSALSYIFIIAMTSYTMYGLFTIANHNAFASTLSNINEDNQNMTVTFDPLFLSFSFMNEGGRVIEDIDPVSFFRGSSIVRCTKTSFISEIEKAMNTSIHFKNFSNIYCFDNIDYYLRSEMRYDQLNLGNQKLVLSTRFNNYTDTLTQVRINMFVKNRNLDFKSTFDNKEVTEITYNMLEKDNYSLKSYSITKGLRFNKFFVFTDNNSINALARVNCLNFFEHKFLFLVRVKEKNKCSTTLEFSKEYDDNSITAFDKGALNSLNIFLKPDVTFFKTEITYNSVFEVFSSVGGLMSFFGLFVSLISCFYKSSYFYDLFFELEMHKENKNLEKDDEDERKLIGEKERNVESEKKEEKQKTDPTDHNLSVEEKVINQPLIEDQEDVENQIRHDFLNQPKSSIFPPIFSFLLSLLIISLLHFDRLRVLGILETGKLNSSDINTMYLIYSFALILYLVLYFTFGLTQRNNLSIAVLIADIIINLLTLEEKTSKAADQITEIQTTSFLINTLLNLTYALLFIIEIRTMTKKPPEKTLLAIVAFIGFLKLNYMAIMLSVVGNEIDNLEIFYLVFSLVLFLLEVTFYFTLLCYMHVGCDTDKSESMIYLRRNKKILISHIGWVKIIGLGLFLLVSKFLNLGKRNFFLSPVFIFTVICLGVEIYISLTSSETNDKIIYLFFSNLICCKTPEDKNIIKKLNYINERTEELFEMKEIVKLMYREKQKKLMNETKNDNSGKENEVV